ncbi:transient receptor potential cation channel subfamily m member 5 [Gigaspora margarita]|uniref:Transient receptor potential cation channel subfamily m member 5 n=1 Tax=Gigaspora margarita TaxID=4874 RepID=A0A8H4APK6_GIGMA|nr:transient receptor potential cation channel subfamily m member 5 [Gigaspora margarita]
MARCDKRRIVSFRLLSVAFKFSATLLPYVTVILEIHNNSVFPNLRPFLFYLCGSLVFHNFVSLKVLEFSLQFSKVEIRYFLIFLAFVLFAFGHALLVLLSEIPPDNDNIANTFASFDQSLKNVWMMLQSDYDSLTPWTNNRLLDILRIVFSFTTVIIILNILIALMNNTYEKLNEHARAVWIAYVAQFVSVMLPFAEYLESYDSSESQKSLNNFKLQDIKDASYIVYDVPTSYFNEQEQIVLAKELCEMSKISDYDPKKFEKMSKMLDIDSSMLDELKNAISKINK